MSLRLTANGEELRKQFASLQTPRDVAALLDIEYSQLIYHLREPRPPEQYTTFHIPKRSGGVRSILAPVTPLKIIQQKLNQVLQEVYPIKLPVHGFVLERSIVTNAEAHRGQKYVFNIDLKDFFPTLNFGRVRGMFMAIPYKLNSDIATVLAKICCYDNQLPQGAPTSPIVSNMICAKMDSQLQKLAKKLKCRYTRYADDLTFSTSRAKFPSDLATLISSLTGEQMQVGEILEGIIRENGFEINRNKVRLQTQNQRQEVTGLTINKFPNVRRQYVRQIRAMLYAWEEFGLEAAEAEFLNRYDKKYRAPFNEMPSFKKVVKGKIDFLRMVRGKDNSIYLRFLAKYSELDPDFEYTPSKSNFEKPLIITEGRTDWKHLKYAFATLKKAGRFLNLDIEFKEYEDDLEMGDAELKNLCVQASKLPRNQKLICIFDRDNPSILNSVTTKGEDFKDWGNSVFSFAIPVPDHRQENKDICIELYYKDSEIKCTDNYGRRLFLSNEFSEKSGRHKEDKTLLYPYPKKISRSRLQIIDAEVFGENDENIALPKNKFAEYVLNQVENFNDFDVSEFEKIFNIILMIARI